MFFFFFFFFNDTATTEIYTLSLHDALPIWLSGGGAAGFELDRADFELGTPPNALVLARSEAHQKHFVAVPEELLTHVTTVTGERPQALIRAEIVYFETVAGGAVFSTGSITFCGSLSHDNYDNNVSRMLENVLRRFAGD